jgi:hypothetical protein
MVHSYVLTYVQSKSTINGDCPCLSPLAGGDERGLALGAIDRKDKKYIVAKNKSKEE